MAFFLISIQHLNERTNIMHNGTGLFFWGFLVVYGIVMFAISPKAVTIGGFFKGTDRKGSFFFDGHLFGFHCLDFRKIRI